MNRPYKLTLFDRLGPDAENVVRAGAYGVIVFGLCIPMFGAASQKLNPPLSFPWAVFWVLGCCTAAGGIAGGVGLLLGHAAGSTWKHLMVDGGSTPYKEQYSYQQALVMRGQLDDALESFEAVIGEKPDSVDARMRAAELYSRNRGDHQRAAELFREIQRIATVSPGEDIYA
ncbi:MAG: tetratricopeptide repeat protein, partial [Gemmatimonadaceae bacterium]